MVAPAISDIVECGDDDDPCKVCVDNARITRGDNYQNIKCQFLTKIQK
jgi:hypothetical protein